MELANDLQNYLDENNLTVDFDGSRVTVLDQKGKVVCTGINTDIAVCKAMMLSECPCQQCRTGPKKR